MTLLDECIDALAEDIVVLNKHEKDALLSTFYKSVPILVSGSLDWSKIEYKEYDNAQVYLQYLNKVNFKIFVISNNAGDPVLKTNIQLAMKKIDDIAALSPDTYLFNDQFVIEQVFPTAIIRVGIHKLGID